MTDTTDRRENPRLEQFRTEIAALRLKEPNPPRDALRQRAGGVLVVAGIAMGALAFAVSQSADDALQQRDAIVVALTGVSVTVAGAALYLVGALSQFLRLWLARFLFEARPSATAAPAATDVAATPPTTAENGRAELSPADPAPRT